MNIVLGLVVVITVLSYIIIMYAFIKSGITEEIFYLHNVTIIKVFCKKFHHELNLILYLFWPLLIMVVIIQGLVLLIIIVGNLPANIKTRIKIKNFKESK